MVVRVPSSTIAEGVSTGVPKPTGGRANRADICASLHQRTVDYPDEWNNGYHVMLDTGKLVTVRWEQVEML